MACVTSLFIAVTLNANSSEWDSQILIENGSKLINKVEMQTEISTGGFNVQFILTFTHMASLPISMC
jgi:hypothetical protein